MNDQINAEERYQERAAILEYCANYSREDAERRATYELWNDKRPVMVGSYSTFEQAKAAALREEQAGQA